MAYCNPKSDFGILTKQLENIVFVVGEKVEKYSGVPNEIIQFLHKLNWPWFVGICIVSSKLGFTIKFNWAVVILKIKNRLKKINLFLKFICFIK